MKTRAILLLNLLISVGASGCAPGLGTSLDASAVVVDPGLVEPGHATGQTTSNAERAAIRVNVAPFRDLRSDSSVVNIDGRLVQVRGDLGAAAQKLCQDLARKSGMTLGLFDLPTITGEILKWRAEVTPGFFSSGVNASGEVRIQVLNSSGSLRYSGVYRGSYEKKHPFLDERSILSALGAAMYYAIDEALHDDRVWDALRAG